MKERLYRFEYDDPEWSVIVPASTLRTVSLSFIPTPDRLIDLGEWELVITEKQREEGDD